MGMVDSAQFLLPLTDASKCGKQLFRIDRKLCLTLSLISTTVNLVDKIVPSDQQSAALERIFDPGVIDHLVQDVGENYHDSMITSVRRDPHQSKLSGGRVSLS